FQHHRRCGAGEGQDDTKRAAVGHGLVSRREQLVIQRGRRERGRPAVPKAPSEGAADHGLPQPGTAGHVAPATFRPHVGQRYRPGPTFRITWRARRIAPGHIARSVAGQRRNTKSRWTITPSSHGPSSPKRPVAVSYRAYHESRVSPRGWLSRRSVGPKVFN